MNWITNYVRPTLRTLMGQKVDTPENLWTKCPSCEQMIFQRDLANNLYVCPQCDHHLRLSAKERLETLFDEGRFVRINVPAVPEDPLRFKDSKKYVDRLKTYRDQTGEDDAIMVGRGTVCGESLIVAAFNFQFMGGSMGMAVGEGLVKAAESAVKHKLPLLVIPASGGARMQEGILSLMQLPRTVLAVQMVREARLPYVVLLSDPTTGGVSASFAMLGDIHLAEPKATIGFAGRRVIEETMREKLPDNFQTAEHLHEHGMVDRVVHRKKLREELASLLGMIIKRAK